MKMAKIDLSKYGISGTTEIVHNPSYELLFEEETKPELEGDRDQCHPAFFCPVWCHTKCRPCYVTDAGTFGTA